VEGAESGLPDDSYYCSEPAAPISIVHALETTLGEIRGDFE
jgi:hypothetical protein